MVATVRYKYTPVSKIETPTQGCLYQAREHRANAWKKVKRLRERLRECHTGPYSERPQISLELLKAESFWREMQQYERDCLGAIEKRANELGLTTKKPTCEGCPAKAVTSDSQGVPLCRACYDSIIAES